MNGIPSWYLQRGGTQYGPYTWEQVIELARSGQVLPDDLLFRAGDAASRPARTIDGLLAGSRPVAGGAPRRNVGIIVGALAAVAALVVGLVVATRDGGGDGSAATTTRVPRTTTATTSTRSTTSSTSTTTSTTSTTTSTTVATTAPRRVASTRDLVAALPREVPAGWDMDTDDPFTKLSPKEGLVSGVCAGPNLDKLAADAGAVAFAANWVYPDTGGELAVGLYAFEDDGDAAAFVEAARRLTASCPSGIATQVLEGTGEDEVKHFTEGVGDGIVWWDTTLTFEPRSVDAGPADERFAFRFEGSFSTTFEGYDYALTEAAVQLFERYGAIVMVNELWGLEEFVGFSDADQATLYTPSLEAAIDATDVVRDGVLSELRARDLIA